MMKKWRCGQCGYIHDGENPPERCPKCGSPKEMFTEIPAEQAQLIERSRKTNGLHLQMHALCSQILEVAAAGLEDNLDPNCIGVFKNATNQAAILQGMIKAEIAGHYGKGKWG